MSTRQLDPDALGDALDRLFRAAWGLCGSREDAEDLVQETYARVLSKPRFLRNDDDIGYLLRTLRHVFFNQLRAARSRPRVDPLPEGVELVETRSAGSPEAALEARELYAAIARLDDDFRDAIVAVDLCGLSYREAGRLVGAREATVTTRLYRARQRLVSELEGREA